MKKVLVIVMLIFAFGCSDDGTNPSENELVGVWKTIYSVYNDDDGTYVDVLLILEFFNTGSFRMINEQPEELIFSEQGTYTIKDNIITINNNKCETEEGSYEFVFKDNGVEFTRIEDECKNNNILGTFFFDYNAELKIN